MSNCNPAHFEKVIFLHVFNIWKIKRIAKFECLEPRRCQGLKAIICGTRNRPETFRNFWETGPWSVLLGELVWRTGHQSRLPPLRQMLVCGLSFSRSQLDGFLRALRLPSSSKLTPRLFQFGRTQDLPENHFRVSGASWVNIIIINYWRNYFVQFLQRYCLSLPGVLQTVAALGN